MNDEELHARLDELAKLELGWDGYGCLPVDPAAIEEARRLIALWPDFFNFVCPLGNHREPGSGIQLEYFRGNSSAEPFIEIEVWPGQPYVYLYGLGGNDWTEGECQDLVLNHDVIRRFRADADTP